MEHKLPNYLRTHRRSTGLSQREMAIVVGCKNGAQLSRYEKGRLPELATALACEIVFRIPVSRLFAGTHEALTQKVEAQIQKLKAKLENSNGNGPKALVTARKLEWLTERARFLPPR